jgi:hypothetical protein
MDPTELNYWRPKLRLLQNTRDALNWIYQTYPNANYEYAGTIYNDGSNNYVATDPATQYKKAQSTPSYPIGRYREREHVVFGGGMTYTIDRKTFAITDRVIQK